MGTESIEALQRSNNPWVRENIAPERNPITKAEERKLILAVKKSLRSKKILETIIPSGTTHSQYLQDILEGENAKQRLVTGNLWLVYKIARRYRGKGVDLDDIHQEGVIGLYRALSILNLKPKQRFANYASYFIHNRITEYLAKNSRALSLPREINMAIVRLYKLDLKLTGELFRKPTISELAIASKLTEQKVIELKEMLKLQLYISRIKSTHRHGEELEFSDLIPSGDLIPEDEAIKNLEETEDESNIFDPFDLTEQERNILEIRYLRGSRTWTFKEISKTMGIHWEYLRKTEHEAVRRLKREKQLYQDLKSKTYA